MVVMRLVPAIVNWPKIMLSTATAIQPLREGFVHAVHVADLDFLTVKVTRIL